jgi:hypothetical protein
MSPGLNPAMLCYDEDDNDDDDDDDDDDDKIQIRMEADVRTFVYHHIVLSPAILTYFGKSFF